MSSVRAVRAQVYFCAQVVSRVGIMRKLVQDLKVQIGAGSQRRGALAAWRNRLKLSPASPCRVSVSPTLCLSLSLRHFTMLFFASRFLQRRSGPHEFAKQNTNSRSG